MSEEPLPTATEDTGIGALSLSIPVTTQVATPAVLTPIAHLGLINTSTI